jgi:hypothetical protein
VPHGKLTALQERILVALAGIAPPWTLSGGAALAGFHLQHRATRDLDLFWQGERRLDDLPNRVKAELERRGFAVAPLQTSESFARFDVREGSESVVVDLVADPVALAEPPRPTLLGGVNIQVDTPHQILVNKLCALLSRSELRDLVDVRALVDAGGDLSRALADCPMQDAGFSPLTLSWVLGQLPIERLASRLSWPGDRVEELANFRDHLVDRILAETKPD